MTIRACAPTCVLNTLLALTLCGMLPSGTANAQIAFTLLATPPPSITEQIRLIKAEVQKHAPPERLGYVWESLAVTYHEAGDSQQALDAHERALHLLAKVSSARADYATTLDNLGALYLEYGRMEEAETVRRQALAIRKEIGDPARIAESQQHLAEIKLAQHRFKEAERASLGAYETFAALPPSASHATVSTLLSALVTATFAECMQSKGAEALRHAEQAMQIVKKAYPPESLALGHVSMALGFAKWKTGDLETADRNMKEGIRILRARLGDRNRMLLGATYEYRSYLEAMHREQEIANLDRQIENMTQPQPNADCARCKVSVYALH